MRTLFSLVGLCLSLAGATCLQAGEGESHWAYRPVTRPSIPSNGHSNPIDAFLAEKGLIPGAAKRASVGREPPVTSNNEKTPGATGFASAAAEKSRLIRRLSYDLLGLPPTPEEVQEFLNDQNPDAYEKLVDRYLSNPHYGERAARMWMDVVRYADSAGYNADPVRPLAYQYRDYLIRAFNEDRRFDRFIQEQLAGDELWPAQPDALIATGFLRMAADESNASNILLARQDQLNDVTSVVGSALLGQSFGCAQCHDHKYDAIPQRDFYRMQAFFSAIVPVLEVPVLSVQEQEELARDRERWYEETRPVREELHQIELEAKRKASEIKRLKFPEPVLNALDTPPDLRTAYQQQLAFYSERQIEIKDTEMLAMMGDEQKSRREVLREQLDKLRLSAPKPKQMIPALAALDGPGVPETHLLSGGSYNKPREQLEHGVMSAIDWLPLPKSRSVRVGSSGRRSQLADWITDPRNPLTIRVTVNRIWQWHFGKGLVENPNDFGVQTAPPMFPELLDWLASEFVQPAHGPGEAWSMKRIHRMILLSQVYRSQTREKELGQARRRLDAESIRDGMLRTSGLLNEEFFGPAVQPELPLGFNTREAWNISPKEEDRRRRSIYILAKRNLPYPLLSQFDLPDMHESCAQRQQTTTAPQALMLINGELSLKIAQGFAGRLYLSNPVVSDEEMISAAFLRAFSRDPRPDEVQASLDFLKEQRTLIEERTERGEAILLPDPFPKYMDPVQGAAAVDFCHALLNANEFLYVD